MIALPRTEEVKANLRRVLDRGSVNLGALAGVERLMLMVTRSCHLRCGYCFVDKREDGPTLPVATARRAVDLLMRSRRPTLEIQLFGGEPMSRPDLVDAVLDHATGHPDRRGRDVRFVMTTNGVALDPAAARRLAGYPVTVLLSLDGDGAVHRRYRPVHRGADATWREDDASTWARIDRSIDALGETGLDWFMNAVVPPAAAGEVRARYDWARARGVPALQLNYAVGMLWDAARSRVYLQGLESALRDHHARPDGLRLFNWASECEPVILSDDLIVDVDGTVLHDAAIFLERRFPELSRTYRRGHLDDLTEFDPLRLSLREAFEILVQSFPAGSEQRRIVLHNAWLGAAVDLHIRRLAASLGRTPGARDATAARELVA